MRLDVSSQPALGMLRFMMQLDSVSHPEVSDQFTDEMDELNLKQLSEADQVVLRPSSLNTT